jgi:hypothetical protein
MKNIIVVLSALSIGYLEATAEHTTDVAPDSPASERLRTASSSSVLAPQKTKPIYIIHDLSFYLEFIDSFKKKAAAQEPKKENLLKEELFHILKSAYYSDPSFSNVIKRRINPTTYVSAYPNAQKKIIVWINEFEADRKQKLDKYTLAIIGLFDGYVPENIKESARSDTESSFINLLDLAENNLDLRDIESTLREVFLLRKNRDEKENTKEDEKADINELDDIDPTTNECFELLFTCLELYKLPTPSRSRAGSFL